MKRMLVVALVGLLLVPGSVTHAYLGKGQVVELVPCEDGEAAAVLVGKDLGGVFLQLVYVDEQTYGERVVLPEQALPDELLVRGAGRWIHVAAGWDRGVVHYYRWEIPGTVAEGYRGERVWMPEVHMVKGGASRSNVFE